MKNRIYLLVVLVGLVLACLNGNKIVNAAAIGVPCSSESGACSAACGAGTKPATVDISDCGGSGAVCCVPISAVTPPATSGAPAAGSQDIEFPNPILCKTMSCFFGNVLNALLGVVAFIALIFIIIGAVMYMLSAGDEQAMERAKKTITAAVAGFAIAAAAPTFLKTVKSVLGGASGVNADDIVDKAYTLKDIAINVLNLLLSITGIIAIIGLIVGAIFYMTSYGDEDRMEKGKKILVASIIGIVIAFASLVIVKQVAGLIAVQ
jgi:hypothetical protein